ncbi:MAG: ROK family transcriptional regulator [Acidobacteriota bacterium]|nr:ROK family transcriptional regulator [Acidobacteriota bacterium]
MNRILSGTQSASNKTPRRINRNLLFNLIRTKQPISRADLARLSGLQRSTVSLIVEELIAERWIFEGASGHLPRGRRPTMIELNEQRAIVALDIHPAQTTVAIVDLGGRILAQSVIELPQDGKKALTAIVAGVRRMMAAHKEKSFDGIGICLPGRTDLQSQKLIFAPNLKWPVLAIKARMERATGLRVAMDNVANACALSEVWFGDSDRTHDLVLVNVSEGIGTGIIANGQLLRGDSGLAGEFGHVEIQPDGPQCACGNLGCWETLASNRAALRYYRELVPGSSKLTFAGLIKLAQAGDKSAVEALTRMARQLARGIRMIMSSLSPGEIVVVGDVTAMWHLIGPVVEAEIRKNSISRLPVLRPAYDGNAARLRSAVALFLSEGTV